MIPYHIVVLIATIALAVGYYCGYVVGKNK